VSLDWLWLLLLGFGTGIYGTLVGAGGGFILAPVLLIFFDVEPKVVAGTALALIAISSLSGAQAYRRIGLIDYRSGLLFAAAALPGSVLGPFVVTQVAGDTFRILFGILLVGITVQLALRPVEYQERPRNPAPNQDFSVRSRRITTAAGQVFEYRFNEALATSINLVLGFMSSFFGTGGGFIRTPLLISIFGFPVRIAVATSVFALSIYTLAGAVTHASLGHLDLYPTFVWAGIGLVFGSQAGAIVSARVKSIWIVRLLVIVLFSLGASLLVQGFTGG
jgi:uncharacterized membrane protein YfcA